MAAAKETPNSRDGVLFHGPQDDDRDCCLTHHSVALKRLLPPRAGNKKLRGRFLDLEIVYQ